jgi:hypothetical protein
MSIHDLPSIDYLRQRLRYEPDTGEFFWKVNPDATRSWNTRYAGKQAFTSKDRHGYHHTNLDGRVFRAHRVAWALHHGAWPEADIDHINHVRSDNRAENLRAVSRADNRKNASRSKNNTSAVCGVSWYGAKGCWQAYITTGGIQRNLGSFTIFADAVAARKAAEARYGFHPNHGVEA